MFYVNGAGEYSFVKYGRINVDGNLYTGTSVDNCKAQWCPFQRGTCNDSCRLFNEPVSNTMTIANSDDNSVISVNTTCYILSCNGVKLYFEKFDDNRRE